MTMRSSPWIAVAIVLSFGLHAGAQRPAGSVSGTVVSDDSPPRPIRRATVSLVSPDLGVPLSTVTGDDGLFSFAGVPAGHYGVVASKPAYVGAFYGSKRPGRGPGVPVAVGAGASVTGISLSLTRGSVIAGTLRLPGGELAHNMPVTAIAVEMVNGAPRLRYAGGRTATDDRGEYRIFGLPAGEYVVIAQPSGLIMGTPTGPNDAPQTTPAEVSWVEEIARARTGAARSGPALAAPARGHTMNYATVFYPGTADFALAVPVQVGPGEERQGVDFALSLVATAAVSGVVVDRSGAPVRGASIALRAGDDRLSIAGIVAARAPVQSAVDGSFTVPAVAPGRYQLVARAPASAASDAGIWALQDVVVDGREISNLALQLQPGLAVSGRLRFDAASTPAPDADGLTRARVTVAPVTPDGAIDAIASVRASTAASVAADGTFAITGLVPASYRIGITMPGVRTTPTAASGAWTLSSIMLDGADVADRAFDLRPGAPVAGVVATFTDRPTDLSGTLVDQTGRPAPGYPIVVFSADRDDWRQGSRRIAIARPSTDGSFRLVGLPAGRYHLAAVVSLERSDVDDPSFLEQLVPASLTVLLNDGVRTVQHLKLAR